MSNLDPLFLASLSPAPPPERASGGPAQPRTQPSQQPTAPSEPHSLRSSLSSEDPPGGRPGAVSPAPGPPTARHMAEMTSVVEDVPCCPLAMPLSLDVSGGAPAGSPFTPLPPQDTSVPRDAPPSSYPPGDRAQQTPVVLQQPFASVGGAKAPSLPQSPAPSQPGAGPGESDGEGRVGRGSFVDSTIKTLDEKLRNLLYQEYAPMYPSGSAADTPGSGTEYVQSPPGPESAAGGSGNSTPGPMGEGRYRTGEQLVKKS